MIATADLTANMTAVPWPWLLYVQGSLCFSPHLLCSILLGTQAPDSAAIGFPQPFRLGAMHKELQTPESAKMLSVMTMGRVAWTLGSLRNERINPSSTEDEVSLWMGVPLEMNMMNTEGDTTLCGRDQHCWNSCGALWNGPTVWTGFRLESEQKNPEKTPGL